MSSAAYPQFQILAATFQEANAPYSITITAILNDYGAVWTGYNGTVKFTSSDPNATLPPNPTFANGILGVGITFSTLGRQTVNVVDINDSSLSGVVSINVINAPLLQPNQPPIIYQEDSDNWSPNQLTASIRDGKANYNYRALGINSATGIQNSLTAIFGTTVLDATGHTTGGGAINRQQPYAHPLLPFWYAKAISSIKGVGGGGVQPIKNLRTLEAPVIPSSTKTDANGNPLGYWGLYPEYQYTIEFGPVPYAVLGNSSINVNVTPTEFIYIDPNGNSFQFGYAEEWKRYTNWIPIPQFDFITYQLGSMFFATGNSAFPNQQPMKAFPKLFLPNQLIKFYWYQVPLTYITSPRSFLNRFAGYVNYFDWYQPAWRAGTLLYLGYTPTVYSPPVPQLYQVQEGRTGFAVDKLVDLEINFLYTSRQGTNLPTPINQNSIPAGHNLLPFIDRNFYYAQAKVGTPPKVYPSWNSFPFELLFTDPDAAIPGATQP
jgi:hypothetical protein